MKCRKCDVELVWDHENPPGYVCPKCGTTMGACSYCEGPSAGARGEFCSELCEGQAIAEEFDDDEDLPEDDDPVTGDET